MSKSLNYAVLHKWNGSLKIEAKLTNEKIAEVGKAFSANFRRLTELAALPAGIVGMAQSVQVGLDIAKLNRFGRIEHLPGDEGADIQSEIKQEFNKLWPDLKRHPISHPSLEETDASFVDDCINQIDRAYVSMSALFSSLIVGSWSMFEALAGDLWEKSVNLRPRLAFVALGTEPLPTDTEDEVVAKSRKKFPFTVEKLRENPEVLAAMGTLLREDLAKFVRREAIIDAYLKIFGKDQSLKDILLCRDLRAVSLLRNAIVHKAGFADDEFCRFLTGDARLGHFKKNDLIVLDGECVGFYCDIVAKRAFELIQFVDDWLRDNKT